LTVIESTYFLISKSISRKAATEEVRAVSGLYIL